MKRVCGVIGCSAAGALLLCSFADLNIAVAAGLLCMVGGIVVMCLPHRLRRGWMMAALLTATAAIALFVLRTVLVLQPIAAYGGEVAEVTAIVCEVSPATADTSASYTLKVTGGDLPAGTRLRYWQNDGLHTWTVGDGLAGRMSLTDIAEQTGDLSLANASYANKIFLYAWPAEYGAVSAADAGTLPWYTRAINAIRTSALENLRIISGDAYGIAAGICLGDGTAIPERIATAFRRSGVTHLLVVSGLHVSLLTFGLFGLLKRRLTSRRAAMITLPVLAVFVCLMGLTPSVVRAGVMMTVVLVSHFFFREADSLNSLGLAFAVLAAADPFCIYDVGLQLSFGATLGILLFYRPLRRRILGFCRLDPFETGWRKQVVRVEDMLCVTLAATLPILPLQAIYFGELSLVSPLTNVLTVGAAEWELVAGWLTILTGWIPGIGAIVSLPFAWIAKLLSLYLIGVTSLLGNWAGAVVSMRSPYLVIWLIGSMVLVHIGHLLLKGRGRAIAAVLSAVCLLAGTVLNTALTFDVITVTAEYRFGEFAVLLEKNGSAGLILDGGKQSWKSARYLLLDNGLTELDFVYAVNAWDGEAYTRFSERFPVITVCSSAGGEVPQLGVGQTLTFWENGVVETREAFVRVTTADTSLLICPEDGDAGILPMDWQENHMVIFTGQAPARAVKLAALQGVWLCDNEDRADGVGTLPWGLYPIDTPDEGTSSVWMTRGNGDVTSQ